ncbi:MAG: cellulase family glycosylhydrolase [Devosia sp.]
MKNRVLVSSSLLLLLALPAFASPPITVDPHGVLLRDGKPYRAIGVNLHDAFWRTVESAGDDTTMAADFIALGKEGIPFARVAATYYYPRWLKAYVDDKEAYLAKLDAVIAAAEANHVGLVLDLFWFDVAVPDLVGEPRSAWGDPKSKTIAFMLDYTRTLVARYNDSAAVWAWEFGNEFNLQADLPNAADFRPPTDTGLGLAATRSAADDLKTKMIVTAFTLFAKAVREIDPDRPITTGNSVSRNFAESTRTTGNWTKIDSRTAYKANLALVTPDPMDMISVHLYPEATQEDRFANGKHASYADLLTLAQQAATKTHKALFVGEWGASLASSPGEAAVKAEFEAQLAAIVKSGAALAAVWDYTSSVNYRDWEWTIRRDNSRAYMLDAIEAANDEMTK